MVTLDGRCVQLRPLTREHVSELHALAVEAGDDFAITTVPGTLDGMRAYVEKALELQTKKIAVPFVTFCKVQNRIVGSTRFGNLEYWTWDSPDSPERKTDGTPDTAEIGWTWIVPNAQRSGVNTEAKWLMLEYAFETIHVRRVTLKTDARNHRSRTAILRIGATFEGILRNHMPASDGTLRDTAMYSIVDREWPDVRAKLRERVDRTGVL